MNDNEPPTQDCIELDDPQPIDDVGQLGRGDRVRIDDRAKPLTVVRVGVQTIDDPYVGEVERPAVMVCGDWDNAQELILTNELDGMMLEPTGDVVDMALGRERDVVRTHVAGSKARAGNDTDEAQEAMA